jgi:beta-propeller uncharacterized protein DUF5122
MVATTRQRSFPQSPNEYHFFTNFLRFRDDGTLDPEFSDDGVVDFETGWPLIYGLYVYSNGQILISDGLNLRRFNANGSPDTTFHFDSSYNGFIQLTCMTVVANGKILVGGLKRVSNGSVSQFFGAVGRFWADGTPDIKFGFHGESLIRAENLDTIVTRFAFAPNEKLLIMAESGSIPSLKSVIARYYITRKP